MVRIKMTRNKLGSPDGAKVVHYEEGKEYDVPESLAKVFIEEDKVAVAVEAPAVEGEGADKGKGKKKAPAADGEGEPAAQ